MAAAGGVAPAAWLIDYDDCIGLAEPVRSTAAFRAALERVADERAARRGPGLFALGFAARFAGGDFAGFAAALDSAFAAL